MSIVEDYLDWRHVQRGYMNVNKPYILYVEREIYNLYVLLLARRKRLYEVQMDSDKTGFVHRRRVSTGPRREAVAVR